MNKALKNIHVLFWGCIPIFLLYGFISKYDIDLNIYDTMFVVGAKYLALLISFVFFITGLGYYLSYKSDKFKPFNALTILHVALTFIGLGLIFFVPEYRYELPAESASDMINNHNNAKLQDNIWQYSWFGVFIAQPILLLNLIISIFRK